MSRFPIQMKWHDLLFAHWPIGVSDLRPLIPEPLEIDTYDGQAWIAIVPFHMTGVKHPLFPKAMSFPELNVRTYVKHHDKRGVWFFSLDAESWLTVRGARFTFGLPYFDAVMAVAHCEDAIGYSSTRYHRGAPHAKLEIGYRPTSEPFRALAGSLEEFLTERYCLFSQRRGRVLRGDIQHDPWPLQLAVAEIEHNSMLDAIGLQLPNIEPLLHFAKFLDVRAANPVPI
ncbi:MAG: DUF2071 domain-containing protein [Chthonomonas sp.]|nr:DUF2071 domain-containing protein [Chthonomonas sp.]